MQFHISEFIEDSDENDKQDNESDLESESQSESETDCELEDDMWCVEQFGIICLILKTRKTPME